MASSLEILNRFKHGMIQFIDELIEQFPEEADLIIIRVFFDNQVPITVVADSFVEHVLPHKDRIRRRDDKFFLENNHMFSMLDTGKVVHFKKLWTSTRLDEDDREAIWKWFNTFSTLVEAYRNSR
jgi:hypothetical protein